jgi:hypothetical protein
VCMDCGETDLHDAFSVTIPPSKGPRTWRGLMSAELPRRVSAHACHACETISASLSNQSFAQTRTPASTNHRRIFAAVTQTHDVGYDNLHHHDYSFIVSDYSMNTARSTHSRLPRQRLAPPDMQ